MKYQNQVVWITGASSGIGRALAIAFAAEGAQLILSARRREDLEVTRQQCYQSDQHRIQPLDLEQPETFPHVVEDLLAHFGRIDVLINNGGISQRAEAMATSLDTVRHLMNVNFFGTVALTQAVLPTMLNQSKGHVVTITSLTGKFGTPMRSGYAASKHALHGYMDSLRAEIDKPQVRITVVCPGYIQTEISKNALTGDGTAQGSMDQRTAAGLTPDIFARKFMKKFETSPEVYIGGWEVLGVTVHRLFPGLFRRLIRRVKTV
jgi:short-subunit dehydrogenase